MSNSKYSQSYSDLKSTSEHSGANHVQLTSSPFKGVLLGGTIFFSEKIGGTIIDTGCNQ